MLHDLPKINLLFEALVSVVEARKVANAVGDIALKGISELIDIAGDILKEKVDVKFKSRERFDAPQFRFRTNMTQKKSHNDPKISQNQKVRKQKIIQNESYLSA